ncbi:protein-L-isoaspartate O-methyltransferase [Tropicimonas sp. IMCC34011]|uniref:protein-L-isoaspartate O-methyltransferase family protein n=1 Tax=Tropicimonas sp. IMCC34011 TaxID=2248759 RepID=UPI000E22D3C1|nr:protein-L-isoaspartate O-methyltransferase [Tropicimonas sp. IMCC34011]
MSTHSTRRTVMVDTQVRPSDVTRYPVIEAMLAVPKELYVPASKRETAYIGENIDLGGDRTILAPRTLSKMLDALDLDTDALVLVVGGAYGYAPAVVARMVEAVIAIEEEPEMVSEAESTLSSEGVDNVAVIEGPLADGAPQHGPYDAILIEGGVETIPEELLAQLKEEGRIVALFNEGRLGVVRLGLKVDGRISWRDLFNAGAPIMPGFLAERAFVF